MARIRYRYNPATCKYEPWYLKGKALRRKVMTFLGLSLVLGLIGCYAFVRHVGSLDEMMLSQRNVALKTEWQILEERILNTREHLDELIAKDDHNYRVILDSSPLSPEIREAGIGGSEKFDKAPLTVFPLIMQRYSEIEDLSRKVGVAVQSFDELGKMVKQRMTMWASRPAIQPISNKQLDRLHMTFGARFHPIFHVYMDHKGLDFTAADGTPVYATGDGKISMVYTSDSYGKVIFIDHGYDYETRYAHLSGFAVKSGEHVKRGQVIGFVGNTGNSVSSHLHYEVLFKGHQINPINFFQRDLNNKEYERLIEIGSQQQYPLD
ncbi:MAG TPA: M23 family metallopeptidase [Ohtaekwangia sp.]|nr:M23 family metallopeptidase [Ohtaekwangia sp.]